MRSMIARFQSPLLAPADAAEEPPEAIGGVDGTPLVGEVTVDKASAASCGDHNAIVSFSGAA